MGSNVKAPSRHFSRNYWQGSAQSGVDIRATKRLKPECSQVGFEFEGPSSRKVAQKFNGGRIDHLRRRRPASAAGGAPHGHSRTFRWLLRRPPRRGRIGHSVPNWPHSKRMRWRLGYDDLNTDDPILWLTGGAASFMATMATTAICRCTFSRASICCGLLQPCNIDASAGSREEAGRTVTQIRAAMTRGANHSAGPIPVSAAMR
jgi:hypothetical protein